MLEVTTIMVEVAVPPDTKVMAGGIAETAGPDEATETDMNTVPEKPLRPASEAVEEPEYPASRVREVGPTDIVKSTTLRVITVE